MPNVSDMYMEEKENDVTIFMYLTTFFVYNNLKTFIIQRQKLLLEFCTRPFEKNTKM